MPGQGNEADATVLLEDAFNKWVEASGGDDLKSRLIDSFVVRHLLDDLSKHFGKNRETFTLLEAAKKQRRELAAAPGVGLLTMRYVAAIFRHADVQTPGNWHRAEMAPPATKK